MLDAFFEWASPIIGAPPDYLKLVFTFIISYPLAALYFHLPVTTPTDRNVKHLFSIVVTSFFLLGLFKLYVGLAQLVAGTVFVWWLCKSGWVGLGGKKGDDRMGWFIFLIIMGQLTINHILRSVLSIPLTTIEISGPMMVLCMKLITFGWNCVDGGKDEKAAADLDSVQQAMKQDHVPDLLPFLGYCFFFPSVLVGPAFDYASYSALISGTLYASPPSTTPTSALATNATANHTSRPATPNGHTAKARIVGPPHGRHTAAYWKLAVGLGFMGVFAVLGGQFGYERILDKGFWYRPGFGLIKKWAFVQMAGFMARTKYYGAWSLTEGACILTGLGFNGYDPATGRTMWDRVKNVDIIAIETSSSFKILFDSWNCRTNVWLRDTVYKRVTPKGKKPGRFSTLMTFGTSAFWHGFNWGYYFAFISASFVTTLGRSVRHLVRPFFLPPKVSTNARSNPHTTTPLKRAYDIVGWLCVQSILNYLASAFMLLGFRECLTAWHRMGWYGHIMIFVPMILLRLGGRRWLIKMNKNAGHDIGRAKGSLSNSVVKGA